MKKFFFILSSAACFLLPACTEKDSGNGGMSDAAKKNLDAFHAVDTAFQTGDISRIDSVVASDFVDHTPKGDRNRDSLKAMITMMKNAGTMKSEIKKEFADDEYVMAWMHWTGTSDGSLPDMPAGPIDMNGIEVVRFKDGKAVEHWAFMDARAMMKMMGSAQMPTSAPTSTDKAK
jgi:predicted SnoaL-like aldol condensation-catalyzing enzyme